MKSLGTLASSQKINLIRLAYDKLSPLPGGKRLFSKLIGLAAPYTGTVQAEVVELRPGRAEVVLADRRTVRNHLDCIHAIALANLAELTANLALGYSLPDDTRFIPTGLSIDYLKKARGTITGVCRCPAPDTSEKHTYEVPVELLDRGGEVVARATLRTLVGPK